MLKMLVVTKPILNFRFLINFFFIFTQWPIASIAFEIARKALSRSGIRVKSRRAVIGANFITAIILG